MLSASRLHVVAEQYKTTIAKVSGSVGVTPKNWLAKKRVAATAAAKPKKTPKRIRRVPLHELERVCILVLLHELEVDAPLRFGYGLTAREPASRRFQQRRREFVFAVG